jgi:hypothetical protein
MVIAAAVFTGKGRGYTDAGTAFLIRADEASV